VVNLPGYGNIDIRKVHPKLIEHVLNGGTIPGVPKESMDSVVKTIMQRVYGFFSLFGFLIFCIFYLALAFSIYFFRKKTIVYFISSLLNSTFVGSLRENFFLIVFIL